MRPALEVRFTDSATRRLAELAGQPRGRIERGLGVLSHELRAVSGPGAFGTGAWDHDVGFLVDARAGTLTVHTVEPRAEALRSLFGPELYGHFRRRWWLKVLHGRR